MSASKAAHASSWLLFRRVWGSMLNLLVTMYLARILPASDFGIVAVSLVLITFCSVISSAGMADYLIYYKGNDFNKLKVSTFWLNMLVGCIISVAIAISAPFWGRLYGDIKITYIVWLFIIPFMSEIVNNVPKAALKKEIDYVPMIKIQSLWMGIAIAMRFVFAWAGAGVYSLVLPTVFTDPIVAWLILKRSGMTWTETLQVKGITRYWKEIYSFTKYLVLQRVLNRIVNEFDNLFVGKSIGLAALAYYNQAFVLANLMTTHVSSLFTELLLPVFSKFRDDRKKMQESYSKVIALLAFLGLLLLVIMIVCAPQLILLLLGSRFSPAILPLQVLSCFAFMRMLNSPSGNIFSAVGRPQLGFYFAGGFAPFFLVTIAVCGQWGLDIFAVSVSLLRVLGSGVCIAMAVKAINARASHVVSPVVPFAVAALVAAGAGLLANMLLFEPFHATMLTEGVKPFKSLVWWYTALGFAANCLLILVCYVTTLRVFFKPQWQAIIDYLSLTNKRVAKVLRHIR